MRIREYEAKKARRAAAHFEQMAKVYGRGTEVGAMYARKAARAYRQADTLEASMRFCPVPATAQA